MRAAADALEKACFVHELAIERYSRFHVKGKATLVRVRKLHEKPGGRAVSWTQGWLAKLNELGEEETELDEEIQLRADEVVDCERKLARQQERVAELMVEARAWLEYDYEKTLAFVHNKEPQSDGSSPGSVRLRLRHRLRRAAHSRRDDGAQRFRDAAPGVAR